MVTTDGYSCTVSCSPGEHECEAQREMEEKALEIERQQQREAKMR
jgi:hypothetical protein